ncbi:hypothetical protein [Chitinophaga sp. sic0106]|uniref:hypothetical protein n=1 Tax=Chitinophaga sp. sic0106 TaxID=2854785 RepID=UPI001C46003D|nr:hypothetical protein [Chitinophaga sp. sic0106]MBV7531100.1 hypothetical protein [Chitinophaga sp. sic0106]
MKYYLLAIIVLAKNICLGQDSTRIPNYGEYFTALYAPKNVTVDGKNRAYAIKLAYKDGKLVLPIEFSKNSTPEFKDFIESYSDKLNTFPWYKFVPAVKGLKNYKIWWMHFYFLNDFESKLYPFSSEELAAQIISSFRMTERDKESFFIPAPYCVYIFAPYRVTPPERTAEDSAFLRIIKEHNNRKEL